MSVIKVLTMCDGWTIDVSEKHDSGVTSSRLFSWNHNEADLGVGAIKEALEYLGYEVAIEEIY